MIREHDRVILAADLPGEGLHRGDIGTVVHVYTGEQAYEVEFVTLLGDTVCVVTLSPSQLRPVGPREIGHARAMT